jgi:DNA repair protein RecO (recombination protein O)
MAQIKDQGVCLRRQDYSETSQIVTMFTVGHGKVRALAKGSRRSHGAFGGGLDLFSLGTLIFTPGRGESGLATLTGFDLQENFSGLRQRLVNLHCAEYAAGLMADFTEEMDPHENLYGAYFSSLGEWSMTETPEKTLVRFELRLFSEIGLAPVWDRCTVCQRDLSTSPRLGFCARHGGIVCGQCMAQHSVTRTIRREVLSIFQKPGALETISPTLGAEAHELLAWYAVELSGQKKPIVDFLNGLLRKVPAS